MTFKLPIPLRPIALAALIWLGFVFAALAQSAGPLDGKVFGSGSKALVVVLHGDVSRGGPAIYHYDIARKIASQNRGVTVLAILRPGYSDGEGRKSRGSNNNRRDHYTRQNNKLVAQTIQAMAAQIGTSKVVALGHSGGAAQLGVILGSYPGLVDSAILISCPCDISRWRSMNRRSNWSRSQSPQRFIRKIAPGTRIIAITGTSDDNTSMVLAQDYVAAATARGLPAVFVPVRGAGHGFDRLAPTAAKITKQELNK